MTADAASAAPGAGHLHTDTRAGAEAAWAARRADRALMLLLGALALAIRLPGLDGDLFIDEIGSLVAFFRPPLDEIVVRYVSANNHVFYSVLAHVSMTLFGEAAWAVRLPAVLFGAATAPALFWLARPRLPRAEAAAAALIVAVSYHHAYFSQNARGYTGMILAAIVTTRLLERALEHGRRRDWLAYAVITALDVYLLLSGVFVCVGQVLGALVLMLSGRVPARVGRLALWTAIAAGLTLLLYAPLLASMHEFFTTADRNVGTPPSMALLRHVLRDAAPNPVVLAGLALALPVGLAGVVSLVRRAPLLPFAFVAPVLIEMGVAMAMGVGTYPRRFLLVLPFVVLVAVRGAGTLAAWLARGRDESVRRRLFTAFVAAGAIAAAAALPRLYTLPKEGYTRALAVVAARRAPDDVVAGAYIADTGLRYYDPSVASARELDDLERLLDDVDARDVTLWLIGLRVAGMHARAPGLAARIEAEFEEVARVRGLVGDGDMPVWRRLPAD